jgi:hypothetical protein
MPPKRTLQGVEAEQFAPMANTLADVRVACRSPNWLAIEAPPDPLPPPPLWTDHKLVAAQP